jgi:hypothetical protein
MSPNRSRIVVNQRAMDTDAGVTMFVAHDVLGPTT